VASTLRDDGWIQDIFGPRTVPMMTQYEQLREHLQLVVLDQGIEDRLVWRWCASGSYSASSTYAVMFAGQTQILGAKELSKVKAPNRCRFFLWLMLHGRNWTLECACHHGLRDGTLYDQEAETMDQLLITCPYAREVWFKAMRRCGWQGLAPAAPCLLCRLVAAHAEA
jgi:hypothetical protein